MKQRILSDKIKAIQVLFERSLLYKFYMQIKIILETGQGEQQCNNNLYISFYELGV